MGPVVIELSSPIQANGETVTRLEITEPDVAALEAMDRETGEIGKALALLSAVTQIPVPALRKLKARDFKAASEAVSGFLQPSR